jgi:D-alanine-D-alanine ligase-like ATP-grasp enzyme
MKQKKESLILGEILMKIAPALGASVLIEPNWGIAGQITFKSGHRSYFRYNTLDLNPVGSSDIAKDKDYANFFMESMGYKIVPQTKAFFSERWGKAIGAPERTADAAYAYAQTLGFPVVVKPNSGSQGSGVAVVGNKEEFYEAINAVFLHDKLALVQPKIEGRDYRIVVLDSEVISAYERVPLSVVGDGESTILELLKEKQNRFIAEHRDTYIDLDDARIERKLKNQKLNLGSILQDKRKIFLLDNANLSTGGDSSDVTHAIHPYFKELAIKLTRDMGLRLCGVDLMVQGDISVRTDAYFILEINAAPGLDHYAKIGEAQKKIVESLYLEVLKHLER